MDTANVETMSRIIPRAKAAAPAREEPRLQWPRLDPGLLGVTVGLALWFALAAMVLATFVHPAG